MRDHSAYCVRSAPATWEEVREHDAIGQFALNR